MSKLPSPEQTIITRRVVNSVSVKKQARLMSEIEALKRNGWNVIAATPVTYLGLTTHTEYTLEREAVSPPPASAYQPSRNVERRESKDGGMTDRAKMWFLIWTLGLGAALFITLGIKMGPTP